MSRQKAVPAAPENDGPKQREYTIIQLLNTNAAIVSIFNAVEYNYYTDGNFIKFVDNEGNCITIFPGALGIAVVAPPPTKK